MSSSREFGGAASRLRSRRWFCVHVGQASQRLCMTGFAYSAYLTAASCVVQSSRQKPDLLSHEASKLSVRGTG